MYDTLIIIHILAAALWIGGGVMFAVLAARAWGSGDPTKVMELSRQGDHVGTRVFAPAALLLIATGVIAVLDADLDFGAAWISIGFTAWFVGIIIAFAWHQSEGRRIREAVEADGVDAPAARRIARLGMAIGTLEILVLVVAVWAMVAKPGA